MVLEGSGEVMEAVKGRALFAGGAALYFLFISF